MKSEKKYLNRELSYLEFNRRVVEVAASPSTPVLEKLRFLTIFATNLDEFFMVRVAGVKKFIKKGELSCDSPDRMSNTELLKAIKKRVDDLMDQAMSILHQEVIPKLQRDKVIITEFRKLASKHRQELHDYFLTNIFPVLTPLAFDPSHPFPYLANLSAHLLVVFKERNSNDEQLIGFVEIPNNIDPLIAISGNQHLYVRLDDLIRENLKEIFVGYAIDNSYFVRVTRDRDYELIGGEVEDLLTTIQSEISQEHRDSIRLEIDAELPASVIAELQRFLNLGSIDVYQVSSPFMLASFAPLLKLTTNKKWFYPPFNPRLPRRLVNNRDIFALISSGDLLVHHPFESFYTVVEFLHEAAHDNRTLAIKQTLYRTSGDSPIIDILITAAKNGKKVTAIVELKARFDEEKNILWAKRLEKAGINVVYGFVQVKTHLKSTIVARKEGERIVQYIHLSTGNYNPKTAETYTDIGLFTANPNYGHDVAMLFNILTGYHLLWNERQASMQGVPPPKFTSLAVAPFNLREKIISCIDQEIVQQKKNGTGMIIAKMNSLVDELLIDKLYLASRAGVQIKLIVRGICCLRPRVKGLSDNIEVRSTVGRFLEHSRIFYFYAGGDKELFLSSADWMPRNMDRRIEVMYPVLDKRLKEQITEFILPIYVNDAEAWQLRSDGTYRRNDNPDHRQGSHDLLIAYARESGIKSIPYAIAIRNPAQALSKRAVTKGKG